MKSYRIRKSKGKYSVGSKNSQYQIIGNVDARGMARYLLVGLVIAIIFFTFVFLDYNFSPREIERREREKYMNEQIKEKVNEMLKGDPYAVPIDGT